MLVYGMLTAARQGARDLVAATFLESSSGPCGRHSVFTSRRRSTACSAITSRHSPAYIAVDMMTACSRLIISSVRHQSFA